MRIGVDAGGTFTDFVALHDDGRIETFKLRSNPYSPASVILEGLARIAKRAEVVHGSTVATNALLQRKGARTAFVTTAGFEDLLEIGRQNRAELYNLTPRPKRLLVPRELCFGAGERTYFDGSTGRKPSHLELQRLARRLRRAKVAAAAICFLHSYQNPENEKAAAAVLEHELGPHVFLCCSHEVSPEFREYERSSTTFVNAYVGPLMQAYLGELGRARGYRVSIMQSNGGFLSAKEAGRSAVRTVLSGPAGGVIGAMTTAGLSGFTRVLGFDMGGTSTDVSLADGAPRETTESVVDGFPLRVPMLDIHTVGAGGGSIARVDAGGLLRVGPESAGAVPGPACYGVGKQPTVTDAHVVLGRIAPDQLLGGTMKIDPGRAAQAVDEIARRLNMNRIRAAAGIVRVANANMERAIRAISIERGYDPREFALVAFGGSGGLHACEMAAELGIRTVVVPEHAGALSALGMLAADEVRDYSAGVLGVSLESREIWRGFERLERRAKRDSRRADIERAADMRYRGQSYELTIAWNPAWKAADAVLAFHREHRRVYGYATPGREVEIVTIRVRARVRLAKPDLRRSEGDQEKMCSDAGHARRVWVSGGWQNVSVLERCEIGMQKRPGPALILDYGSTTLIPPKWQFRVDRVRNLIATSF